MSDSGGFSVMDDTVFLKIAARIEALEAEVKELRQITKDQAKNIEGLEIGTAPSIGNFHSAHKKG